jgi:hypothetical protein
VRGSTHQADLTDPVSLTTLRDEATFWVGGALFGKEIVARFKRYLNPCNWCRS